MNVWEKTAMQHGDVFLVIYLARFAVDIISQLDLRALNASYTPMSDKYYDDNFQHPG